MSRRLLPVFIVLQTILTVVASIQTAYGVVYAEPSRVYLITYSTPSGSGVYTTPYREFISTELCQQRYDTENSIPQSGDETTGWYQYITYIDYTIAANDPDITYPSLEEIGLIGYGNAFIDGLYVYGHCRGTHTLLRDGVIVTQDPHKIVFYMDPTCPAGYEFDATVDLCAGTGAEPDPGAGYPNPLPPPPDPNDPTLEEEKGCNAEGVGNPCNPATGNKYQREVDYLNAGTGLAVIRSYNSQTKVNTGFGVGWSGLVKSRLEIGLGGYVVLRESDGRGQAFSCPSSGPCQSDADTDDLLSMSATEATLSRLDGSSRSYDTLGRLLTETDSSGRSTQFTYNTSNQLETVTGPYGHSLTYAYHADGHLQSVTDDTNQAVSYTYFNNNLALVRYPDGTSRSYHYEDFTLPHHLTGISIIDSSGVETRYATYTYDANGLAIATEHAAVDHAIGQEYFTLDYDTPSPNQTTVTDAAGHVEIYTFEDNLGAKNLLRRIHQGDNKGIIQTFDANNNRRCHQDAEGNVTTYSYNASNQLTSMTEGQTGFCNAPTATPETRTTTYEYLSPDLDLPTVIRRPSVLAGSDAITEIRYGNTTIGDVCDGQPANLPCQVIQSGFQPDGTAVSRATTLGYNSNGQVISIDGPRTDVNDITTLDYYACTTGAECGQLKSVTNALGHRTTYDAYYADGRLQQMTDPNGVVTTIVYDNRGRIDTVTQTPPAGSTLPARVTHTTYTAFGAIETLTTPGGTILTYAYDAAQDLRSITDNLGNRIEYDYDARGNQSVTRTLDPDGSLVRQIEQSHNHRNHLEAITQGGTDGSLTTLITDAVGNLTASVDPNNNVDGSLDQTTHTPDPLNRLVKTVDLINGITDYGYDAHDNLTQVKAPNGATTDYVYDDLGDLLQETSPDRGTITYTHDDAGNVKTITDQRLPDTPYQAQYSYDALNRVTAIVYTADYLDPERTFIYDNCVNGIGRLCHSTVTFGHHNTYAYNGFGEVIQDTRDGEGYKPFTTGYSYDNAGRVATITYPDGRVVSYTRNTLGQPTRIDMTLGGVSTTVVSNRTYQADGLVRQQTFGNGLTENRTHDLKGQLSYYALDSTLGNIETRDYTLYDANGNLKTLTASAYSGTYIYDALDRLTDQGGSLTDNYTYDANGNRETDSTNGYTYVTASNRLETVNTQAITYDGLGNTKSDTQGRQQYLYDSAGRLFALQVNDSWANYFYNAQGLRSEKRQNASSLITLYHYDPQGRLLLETRQTQQPLRAYVWAGNQVIAQIDYTDNGEVITYLHTDHLNTPRLGTNATGQVTWRWESQAFGASLPNEDPDNDGVTTTVNLRFPGQYYDAESGLHYNWNRFYDPALGRYVTSDPIGLSGGLNTYTYVSSNPLRWIDPFGLEQVDLDNGAWVGANTDNATPGQIAYAVAVTFGAPALLVLGEFSPGLLLFADVQMAIAFDGMPLPGGCRVTKGPKAGGGGSLDNLSSADIKRIQNAASRTNQEITVVGSRASGKANATSDWDYIMSGKSSQRRSARSSVPRGTLGGEINSTGRETGIDLWQSYNPNAPGYSLVNTNQPYITFFP